MGYSKHRGVRRCKGYGYSRGTASFISDAWHGVNDAIAEIVVKSCGTAPYVVRERPVVPLECWFRIEEGAA